jgi:hypothetical protein
LSDTVPRANQTRHAVLTLSILALCWVLAASLMGSHEMTSNLSSRSGTELRSVEPLSSLIISVPLSSRSEFYAQLRAFAKAQEFECRITQYKKETESITISMQRKELWVIGGSEFDPLQFTLEIFAVQGNEQARTKVPTLTATLKEFIKNTPDVRVLEK